MKKIKCSSDNSLLVSPSLKLIAAAAISCAALGASAATYYWKGGAQGLWTTASNWSTEGAGGEDATDYPRESDVLDNNIDFDVDLGSGVFTITGWGSNAGGWDHRTWTIRNGSLTITGETRTHAGDINIESGGVLIFPSGSTFYPGVDVDTPMNVNVKDGGALSVLGTARFYRSVYNVAAGGALTFSPTSIRTTSSKANEINNSGTLNLPNGMVLGQYDSSSSATVTLNQIDGTLNLGGSIDDTNASNPSAFNVVFSGGTVNVTGDATFNVTSVSLANSVTFNVDSGKTVNLSSVDFASGSSIVKTGEGAVILPATAPTATISAGKLALSAATYDLAAVRFSAGSKITLSVLGATVNACDPSLTENAVFEADLSTATTSATILNSSNSELLEKAKGDLESAGAVPSDKQLEIKGTMLKIENKSSEYVFSAEGASSILDPAGWGGSIPADGSAVTIAGSTTVATFTSGDFPKWSSVEVRDSAVLQISADADLPQITLYPDAKLEILSGTTVMGNGFSGSFEVAAQSVQLPILALATNATLMVASDMKFKNVDMRLCGTVTKSSFNDVGPTFGYADNGEVSYFAMTADGAKFEIHSAEGDNGGDRENGRICFFSPASGGTVLAVGDVLLKNCTRPVNSWGDYGNTIFGQNNPVAAPYNVILDGTSIEASAFVYIAGATRLSLVNNSHISRHSSCLGHYFSQAIQDAATVDIGEGCYLDFTTGDGLFGIDSQSAVDAVTVRNGGAYTVSYNSSGWVNGVFVSDGGVLGVSKLYKSSSGDPRERPQDLLAGFGSARLDGDLLISSVNMGTGNYDWDRHTTMANIPFSGTGDVTITNGVPAYPFTVTMRNGSNTATGTIKVAKADGDAETTLYFADGANWAGTVTAGNVALTNLVNGASASTNTFDKLYLAAGTTFPIRVQKSNGSIVTHDGLNVTQYINNGGVLSFEVIGQEAVIGDGFILGTIGADSPLPAVSRPWSVKREGNFLKVRMSSGLSVIFK